MNTCKTCKCWREAKFRTESPPMSWGFCSSGKMGACGMLITVPPKAEAVAYYNEACGVDELRIDTRIEDGSGEILTGPEFGCVHHEPK